MLRKKKTIIIIVLLSALVITGLGTIANTLIKDRLAHNLLEEYQAEERQVAAKVADNLTGDIAGVHDKLNILATIPEIIGTNAAACNAKLSEAFAVMSSKVGNLGRVGADGYFYCSMNKALIGFKAEKLGAYIPQIFNDPEHTPVLSRAVIPPGANTYIAALHVPVYNASKQFVGTIGGAVYFSELQDKYLKNVTFAQNGYIILLDDNGDVLYHPIAELIGKNIKSDDARKILQYSSSLNTAIDAAMRGKSGDVRYTTANGERLASYAPAQILPGHHWTVIVSVPATEAAAQLARLGVDEAFIWFTIVLAIAVAVIAVMMLVNLVRSYELQKTKDEFVDLASHQLRTPATAVKDYIELLLDDSATLSTAQKEYITTIQQSNQREIGIINDMLNVARLDAGRIEIKPKRTDIGDIVHDVVAEQLSTIQERAQQIFIHTKAAVHAPLDPIYGRMVIENLVSNASKYTHHGGIIDVTIGLRGKYATIAVKDTGVGIAKKDMDKLFGKLNRIPNELSSEAGGTGLGLYLAKKIIERHGGKINVDSQLGKGTTFTVFLPRSTPIVKKA